MIDHLVLATPDVAATSAALAAEWGELLTPGGSHVGLGTRNELTGLGGGSYLEIVGPDHGQPDPAGARPFGVDHLTSAALVAWCARPVRPLDDVIADCARAGVHLGDVASMSRVRPDGELLRWRLTFPLLSSPYLGTLPFLIDWQQSQHPAATLPHRCTLERLTITHPRSDMVRAVLDAVGHDNRIAIAEGDAALDAAVRTPNGQRRLHG